MITISHISRRTALAGAAGLAATGARAAETLRVGKTIVTSFPMAGVDLGKEQGFFAAEGLDLVISTFRGDGQVQQALTAGAVDIAFGSGPGMGYASKGVPAHAVAAMAYEPRNMCLVIPKSGPVKTIDDLKGTRVGVSTAGSLTDWLVRSISVRKGWGPDGIETVPMGDVRTRAIAMKSGELQGSVTAIEEGYDYRQSGGGDILMDFSEFAPDFLTHVIFATDALIKNKPDVVRAFLRGWFKTIAFMRDNRAATVKSIAKSTGYDEGIINAAYDQEMKMISFDGAFSKKALDVIRGSLKEVGITDTEPAIEAMYAPGFVAVKP